MGRLFTHPDVVCTELEDGAVLLNLETRNYYSLDRIGLEIWNLVDSAPTSEEMVDELLRRHDPGDADPRELVDGFLERLRAERLVVEAGEVGNAGPAVGSTRRPADDPTEKLPLTPPRLLKHDEPLHEVPLHPFDPQLPLAE